MNSERGKFVGEPFVWRELAATRERGRTKKEVDLRGDISRGGGTPRPGPGDPNQPKHMRGEGEHKTENRFSTKNAAKGKSRKKTDANKSDKAIRKLEKKQKRKRGLPKWNRTRKTRRRKGG